MALQSKGTPLSKKKIMNILAQKANNSFNFNHKLNTTVYTTGMREVRNSSIQRDGRYKSRKRAKKKNRAQSRGESPKSSHQMTKSKVFDADKTCTWRTCEATPIELQRPISTDPISILYKPTFRSRQRKDGAASKRTTSANTRR